VVSVRRETARATPTFRKKLQQRRVQRLNGRVSELVREPTLLSFQTEVMEPSIDLRTLHSAHRGRSLSEVIKQAVDSSYIFSTVCCLHHCKLRAASFGASKQGAQPLIRHMRSKGGAS
jgi:hypothetical protein